MLSPSLILKAFGLLAWALRGLDAVNTYYVSAINGSDTNDGISPLTPFETIKKARDAVQGGGDTVVVFDGTYYSSNYGDGRYVRRFPILTINRGGNEIDGYVTYKAADRHRPKLIYDGGSAISISGNVNYVVIDGFEIEGPAQSITYEMAYANRYRNSTTEQSGYYTNRGIAGFGPSHHIVIKNCFVHNTCGSGIRMNDADYVSIVDCTVANTSWWSSSAESAIVMAEASPIDDSTDVKMIFHGNMLFDNWNRIPFYQPSHDGLNAYPDYGEASQDYILDGQGLYVTRCHDSYRGTFLFENNIVVNSGKNGINFDGVKAGGAIIAHNTLYLNGAFDFVQTEHHGPNQVAGVAAKKVGFMNVTNNIVVCRNSTYSAFSVWDDSPTSVVGNMLVDCSVNLRIPDESTMHVNNPYFVYPSLEVSDANFRLASTSPAIDAAAATTTSHLVFDDFDGVSRPQGSNADVGAFEYVEIDTTTATTTTKRSTTTTTERPTTTTERPTTTTTDTMISTTTTTTTTTKTATSPSSPNMSTESPIDPAGTTTTTEGDITAATTEADSPSASGFFQDNESTVLVGAGSIVISGVVAALFCTKCARRGSKGLSTSGPGTGKGGARSEFEMVDRCRGDRSGLDPAGLVGL